MNATKSTNPTKDFPHKRRESNSHNSNVAASRIPTITGSNRSSSSNLLLEASSPTSSQSPIVATTATQEYSRVPQSAMATMAFAGEEMGAVVYKDTTKLISTAIKFININNNSNNNDNSGQHRTNSQTSGGNSNSNSNKSTSKSTATSDVDKSASSKFINSRNKLTTITHVRQQQQEQTQQQRRQQAEQILSTTRDLNQINLKSSLYADQQACNDNHNSNNKNMDNNQRNDIHNKLNANVCRSNNNNPNSLNNDNNKKQLRAMCETPNNSNESCSDEAYDSEHNNSRKSHKNNNTCSNGNVNESNELEQQQQLQQPPSHQQQLITATKASKQTIKIVTASEIKTATKVRAEKIATTAKAAVMDTTIKPTASAAPAKERAKAATLTLRKSLSTPASFKTDDVACSHKSNNSNNNYNYSHVDSNGHSNNVKLLISGNAQEKVAEVEKMEALRGAKDNDNGGGGGGGGGCGNAGNHDKCTKTAAKFTNTSIEATTATTQITTITAASTSTKAATMDVVMRPQYAVHGAQLEQQQQQQPDTKLAKAKVNDNQIICGSCNATGSKDVASTTNASSSLPLPAVSFDLDLRFGCAHYKRRAMFVTPCCNKFYKCRFCHDENESHHFDRKTLTELICSECNTRQKVQEQCEACGTRFGKYTCLICNLFDDTDKKQYHCNGCGICRIGGAENFFHCEVCDMCLPIRLKIDGHRCVENISRSHCPVCLGDIHTSRIPCHIPDCGHLLHKTCFDQLLNSGHYTCPICQTSLIDMTALWEYLDAQAVSLPVPKKYENQRIHIFCNDCHKTSKTKFNFIGLKCMQCGAYNTTQDVKRRMSLVTDEPSSA
ncbi:rho GTPase-activating protein gacU [Anastrepha ludens]|uniref:rho GTPase-activating protein gacU n=1 Tax=Anastrepha ludens TaxID=28586 RepID=UPI0023AFC9B7|nr:rho GTPase-activating protein gacU [Anastrepha ludens]XP_053961247.1 rho GTPase-activating protein gacU [Anastrepha ludens]XP_053961248.1 rho GTPase-activating protein gacU [Anastrepha ludens]XP_053961249.1 rho GTPase-activating protein gacU [Anastrepha ludens]XP_053961250.1 rho GTPase-activating protein gacU [Anastrepha ludens]XP_053961251.1 rho GTPase-activating protein gacU [Anastrepha ludens]